MLWIAGLDGLLEVGKPGRLSSPRGCAAGCKSTEQWSVRLWHFCIAQQHQTGNPRETPSSCPVSVPLSRASPHRCRATSLPFLRLGVDESRGSSSSVGSQPALDRSRASIQPRVRRIVSLLGIVTSSCPNPGVSLIHILFIPPCRYFSPGAATETVPLNTRNTPGHHRHRQCHQNDPGRPQLPLPPRTVAPQSTPLPRSPGRGAIVSASGAVVHVSLTQSSSTRLVVPRQS